MDIIHTQYVSTLHFQAVIYVSQRLGTFIYNTQEHFFVTFAPVVNIAVNKTVI